MMSGGPKRRSAIGGNLIGMLREHLRTSPCVVHSSDACVQVTATRFVCPDLTVNCDPRDQDSADEEEFELLKYPKLAIEILSRSTKSVDKGEKPELYQDISTLQEYVIGETRLPGVLLYRREESDRWTAYILGWEYEIELASIGIRFPIAEIYEKTHFTAQNETS